MLLLSSNKLFTLRNNTSKTSNHVKAFTIQHCRKQWFIPGGKTYINIANDLWTKVYNPFGQKLKISEFQKSRRTKILKSL